MVTLRPVVESDLRVFEEDLATETGSGEHQWFGFTPVQTMRRQFVESGLLAKESGMLTVVVDGEVAGRVAWLPASWGRETSLCWTIAAGLRPHLRGRGYGTQAQRLLVDYLFRHTRAERIQAFTDVANVAEQKALERAGFTREGVLAAAQWRDGAWHDQVLYAIVRSSWAPSTSSG